MGQGAQSLAALAVQMSGQSRVVRALPEEVAVAITVNGSTYAVMMATPAQIEAFALGFALTEGIVQTCDEIESLAVEVFSHGIEARLWVAEARAEAVAERRRAMMGPVGCGLCGIESLEQAVREVPRVAAELKLSTQWLLQAGTAIKAHQPLHDLTRAVHAAGFLNADGSLVAVCEDVGRHNALDKLIGRLQQEACVISNGAIVLTSRVSVELVQKAAMAGCPVIVAVSAPTVQAVELAQKAGITIAAFARPHGFECFTHPERIEGVSRDVA